jgi:hypothetical protein
MTKPGSYTGVLAPGRCKALKVVLEEWITLNKLMAEQWRDVGDVPWWYNERASISVLAGAVWRRGNRETDYAFEEYGSTKKGVDGNDCAGRQDVEFSFVGTRYIAEAKQCYIPIMKDDLSAVISRAMQKAEKDIKRCDDPYGARRLAITFGAPYISEKRANEIDARMSGFIKKASSVAADLTAWVFPRLAARPVVKGRIYPGVVVWIKEVTG